MDGVKQYIISVTAAAILCSIVTAICSEKRIAPLLKLITGIFLTFVAIQPLADIELTALPTFAETFAEEAEGAAEVGKDMANENIHAIIKSRVEAYILDKAAALGVDIAVDVTINEEGIPVKAKLNGSVSPSAKSRLQSILEKDLGIPKEDQQWSG